MSNQVFLSSAIAYREDYLKNWQTKNPILNRGEPSFVRDGEGSKWLKIGDGITAWNELPYKEFPKGDPGEKGADGKDYVLTEADKQEIASMVEVQNDNPILKYLTYEITEDNTVTITGCDTSISGNHIIPDTIEGYPVTSIGIEAFGGCDKLTSIALPNGLIDIGDMAFVNCLSLTSITIPNSVMKMGDFIFEPCPLYDVYYMGSKEQWNNIDISTAGNDQLLNLATIHYDQALATEGYVKEKVGGIETTLDSIIDDEGEPASVNIYNWESPEVVSNSIVNVGNGELTTDAYVKTSGFIPVECGKTYTFPVLADKYGWSGTSVGMVAVYDADKNFVRTATGTLDSNWLLTVTISDERDAFIRTSMSQLSNGNSKGYNYKTMMVVEGTEYPSEFIPYREATSVQVLRMPLATDYVQNLLNPLYKKTIIWNGDSICAGKAFDDEGDAWAGRIANRNNMTYKNYAVGGGTITEGLTSNGVSTHSISGTLDTMYAEFPNADYIIIEGGTNDADIIGSHLSGNNPEKFGTFNETQFTGAFDRNTFCGALESIFQRATNYWKGKKICFIVAHKMGWSGTGYGAEVHNRRNYFETAMKIAKKWGIPVLNLWDGCYLNPSLTTMWKYDGTWQENKEAGKLYADGQHLLSAGYDYTADIINNWLKAIGLQGEQGIDGTPGYTPQKGVDYYTEADKQEMVNLVLASLPNGDEVSY